MIIFRGGAEFYGIFANWMKVDLLDGNLEEIFQKKIIKLFSKSTQIEVYETAKGWKAQTED